MTTPLDSDELFNVIIDILAVSVLIDNRTKDRELIEFVHAATLHNQHLRPNKMLSRRMMLEKFNNRKAYIMAALENDKDDSFKLDLLSHVTDKALQRSVLGSIFTIAICDYELHDEECNFIKSALKVWNTHMLTPADLEAVA